MVVHRFGPFELDLASGRLFRGARRVPLSDTQSALLVELVRHAGEIVSSDTLIRSAWGTTSVADSSLRQGIRRLRQTLGDGMNGAAYIETHRTQGFRFTEDVKPAERDDPAVPPDEQMAADRAVVRGRTLLEMLDVGAVQRARCEFEEAVRQAAHLADAHVGLAMACALIYESTVVDPHPDTASLQCAIEHARRACDLAPSSGEAWSTRAFVLYLRGEREDAAAAARRATGLEPEDMRHALRLGYVSWGDARLRAARTVLTHGSGLPLAHWLRATVFIARGRREPALEELRAGCAGQDIHPKGAGFLAVGLHLLLGHVLAADGQLDEAAAELTRELSWADSGQVYARECAANTWYALGAVRLRQKKRAEAEEAFARALNIAPCHASASAALRGDVPSSARGIDRAIGQAIVLARRNRHAEAASIYREALLHAPPGPDGWILAVEPLINPLEHGDTWAEALALLRIRAT